MVQLNKFPILVTSIVCIEMGDSWVRKTNRWCFCLLKSGMRDFHSSCTCTRMASYSSRGKIDGWSKTIQSETSHPCAMKGSCYKPNGAVSRICGLFQIKIVLFLRINPVISEKGSKTEYSTGVYSWSRKTKFVSTNITNDFFVFTVDKILWWELFFISIVVIFLDTLAD
jgi:hypothetical protein